MISAATASSGRALLLFTIPPSSRPSLKRVYARLRRAMARAETHNHDRLLGHSPVPTPANCGYGSRIAPSGASGMTAKRYSRQCRHTPLISITGLFGVKPALFAAALTLSATAPDAASPTATQCSHI